MRAIRNNCPVIVKLSFSLLLDLLLMEFSSSDNELWLVVSWIISGFLICKIFKFVISEGKRKMLFTVSNFVMLCSLIH